MATATVGDVLIEEAEGERDKKKQLATRNSQAKGLP